MKSSLKISIASIGLVASVLLSAAASTAADKISAVDYIVEDTMTMAGQNEFFEQMEPENIEEIEMIYFVDGDGTRTMDSYAKASESFTHGEWLMLIYIVEKLGDPDAIERLYRDAGMRVGTICCYTPEGREKAKYYEGFDFSSVWTMKDGMPELRIFG